MALVAYTRASAYVERKVEEVCGEVCIFIL